MMPFLLVLALLWVDVSQQSGGSTSQRDVPPRPKYVLLQDISSPDWTVRAAAVRDLIRANHHREDAAVGRAVIALLSKEIQLARDAATREGAELELGEDYVYYKDGPLTSAVIDVLQQGNLDALPVLAKGSFNPDSRLSAILATEGAPTVVPALGLASANSAMDRANGLFLLAQILDADARGRVKQGIPLTSRLQAMKTIRDGTKDANAVVRRWAVRSLELVGTWEDIPLLETLMRTDPDRRSNPSKALPVAVSVPELAESALRTLRSRLR